MYFQQVAEEGQKKSEWVKRKQRLMAFFTQDVKVKACVGMKDMLFVVVFDYRTTLGFCALLIALDNNPLILCPFRIIHNMKIPHCDAKRSTV